MSATLVENEPLYCHGCRPRPRTLGKMTPLGFENRGLEHTYTYGANGVLVIQCGHCGGKTNVRVSGGDLRLVVL